MITLMVTALLTSSIAAEEPSIPDATGAVDAPSIAIAVPNRDAERRIEVGNRGSHIHVVVTNSSNREQRLWETWNSWGYFNLRFEVLDDKGSVAYQITKNRNKRWTRNFPSWVALKPGEYFVMDVYLDRETWIMPFLKTTDSQ